MLAGLGLVAPAGPLRLQARLAAAWGAGAVRGGGSGGRRRVRARRTSLRSPAIQATWAAWPTSRRCRAKACRGGLQSPAATAARENMDGSHPGERGQHLGWAGERRVRSEDLRALPGAVREVALPALRRLLEFPPEAALPGLGEVLPQRGVAGRRTLRWGFGVRLPFRQRHFPGDTDVFISNCTKRHRKPLILLVGCLQLLLAKLVILQCRVRRSDSCAAARCVPAGRMSWTACCPRDGAGAVGAMRYIGYAELVAPKSPPSLQGLRWRRPMIADGGRCRVRHPWGARSACGGAGCL